MYNDHMPILRRNPKELPPWKLPVKKRNFEVFDEDWGGTYDEMLLTPASVKCALLLLSTGCV